MLARETFTLSRGTFHALVGGPARDASAPRPVLYLHGFPDHPPTAAPFLAELARTRRVIAPWMRGYAPSPLDGPFDVFSLARELAELIDHVGGPVDVVGHDWGAAITYVLCVEHPGRVGRAATLAFPHPLTFVRSLRTPAQLRRSWYMGLFQLPGAGWLAGARDLALIDRLWRAWSPGFTLDAARRAELHACLRASLPAPLGYYRALARTLPQIPSRVRAGTARITTPVLQLHGADDSCVAVPTAAADAELFVDRELAVVPGVGHFPHVEAPGQIASRVSAWLDRK